MKKKYWTQNFLQTKNPPMLRLFLDREFKVVGLKDWSTFKKVLSPVFSELFQEESAPTSAFLE